MRIAQTRIDKALAMVEDYLCKNLDKGINTDILVNNEEAFEVDVEVRCEYDGTYDRGSYDREPSWTGKITNTPVSIIGWFFDEDYTPVEKNITPFLEPYTYSI